MGKLLDVESSRFNPVVGVVPENLALSIREEFRTQSSIGMNRPNPHPRIPAGNFVEMLEYYNYSIVVRSLIWMVCRTVPEPPDRDVSREVRRSTLLSEFNASQTDFDPDHTGHYQDIYRYFALPPVIFHAQILLPSWYSMIHSIVSAFAHIRLFEGNRIVYPKVQRKKNVSRSTAHNYRIMSDTDIDPQLVTTSHLECLYHSTGLQVGGDCEMRSAWKFNDLKPRYYYCIGGTPYWASRYIKPIAVELMECIPSTKKSIRRNPEHYLSLQTEDDSIVYWDYSAFTSSLSDLKLFLYYLTLGGRSINPGATLLVFDSNEGLIELDAWDYIDTYNSIVNVGAPFSMLRIIDDAVTDFARDDTEYVQHNSGMLGVAGNIGFSTACHGTVACVVCGEDRCVCVGDDAMGFVEYSEVPRVVAEMSHLAPIQQEKFGIVGFPQDETFKFLKRGVRTNGNFEIVFDTLLNLPITPYIDGSTGSRTTYQDLTQSEKIYKTFTSIGNLYWSIHDLPSHRQPTDSDMLILSTFLLSVYDYMRIPQRGLLPGSYLKVLSTNLWFCIPPCVVDHDRGFIFDPRVTDWAEFLYYNASSEFCVTPVMSPRNMRFERPFQGESVFTTMNQGWKFLEDFGYVKSKKLYESFRTRGEENYRVFRRFLKSTEDSSEFGALHEVEIVSPIPSVFDHLFERSLFSEGCTKLAGKDI